MVSQPMLEQNATYQIIQNARRGRYAVPGVCVYNLEGILATIQAAESERSPVMIQLFPWAMHFYGAGFIEYCRSLARAAAVPVSIHLDHCLKESDAELALTMAFDSIMIDGSSLAKEEDAIQYCRRITEMAHKLGITIEAELGRIDGAEDGLPALQLEELKTSPDEAVRFVQEVQVQFLAPSFGNVHGPYGPRGPQWDKQRLAEIEKKVGNLAPLVLHGTTISDEWFKAALELGFSKININGSPMNHGYKGYLKQAAGQVEFTHFLENSVSSYKEGIIYYMRLFGSSGKATTA